MKAQLVRSIKMWVGLLGLLSLAACSSIQVNTDYDTSRQYSALKTYAWMKPKQEVVIDPLVNNDLMQRRVERAVERSLAAQGFVKATGEQSADFLVTYYVSAETKLSVTNFHSDFGYYPCWGGCYRYGFGYGMNQDISVRQYKVGTFMLDIIDPATSELMWRGAAGKQLSTGTPEERDTYVTEIISAILAKFPPN